MLESHCIKKGCFSGLSRKLANFGLPEFFWPVFGILDFGDHTTVSEAHLDKFKSRLLPDGFAAMIRNARAVCDRSATTAAARRAQHVNIAMADCMLDAALPVPWYSNPRHSCCDILSETMSNISGQQHKKSGCHE